MFLQGLFANRFDIGQLTSNAPVSGDILQLLGLGIDLSDTSADSVSGSACGESGAEQVNISSGTHLFHSQSLCLLLTLDPTGQHRNTA